jgi:hypothetical protein
VAANDAFTEVCGKLCWVKERAGKGTRDTAQYTKMNMQKHIWRHAGSQVCIKSYGDGITSAWVLCSML